MTRKALIGNIVSAAVGLFLGAVAFAINWRWLSAPETLLEWALQICAGLTVGIICFFLTWGHFQDPPQVGPEK